jgi:hypothetical protein
VISVSDSKGVTDTQTHIRQTVHKRPERYGSGGSSRQAPRDPDASHVQGRVGILHVSVGRHARHSCYRYTQVGGPWGGRISSKRHNAYKTAATLATTTCTLLGSPATGKLYKLKSFRGFYGFREDIREARALREIDQSVVSAAIRVSSFQVYKTSKHRKTYHEGKNMYALWQAPKTGRNFEAPV